MWEYNNHWVLENVYVTVNFDEKGNTTDNIVGQVARDGILLNKEYSYEEVFGFRLMKGKPFYFYKENGKIGISYDGQNYMLGFEEIPATTVVHEQIDHGNLKTWYLSLPEKVRLGIM